jgi:ABC-type nitrate/sulfonate/bicarbonate transport system permease component
VSGPKDPDPAKRQASPLRLRLLRAAAFLAVPLTLISVWVALSATGAVGEIFLPHPGTLWERISVLHGQLLSALWVSLQMIALGLLIGASTGILVGLLIGFSRLARDLFEFTVDGIRPIPLFALIPLFILWFGIGRTPQIALVALGVFLILSFTTIEAVRNVPRIYVRAALTCGASRFDVYRTVVLPAIVPELMVGIRYGAIAAWGLDVAAEFSGSQEGLGYFMIVRGQYLDTAGITLAVLIYCALAIVVDRTLRLLGRRLQRWNPRVADRDFIGDMLGGAG